MRFDILAGILGWHQIHNLAKHVAPKNPGRVVGFIHAIAVLHLAYTDTALWLACTYFGYELLHAILSRIPTHLVHGLICFSAYVYTLVHPEYNEYAHTLLRLEITTPLMHIGYALNSLGYKRLAWWCLCLFGCMFFCVRIVWLFTKLVCMDLPFPFQYLAAGFYSLNIWWLFAIYNAVRSHRN